MKILCILTVFFLLSGCFVATYPDGSVHPVSPFPVLFCTPDLIDGATGKIIKGRCL